MRRLGLLLTIIGALNWGLVGLFGFDLVAAIFGPTFWSRAVYTIIGIAGLMCIPDLLRTRAQA